MKGWLLGGVLLFAALPSTTTYQLQSYGFGSGGANSSTTTYSLNGVSGDLGGQESSTTTYGVNSGLIESEQTLVPTIALDNESGLDYNKLHFVITKHGNTSDDTYIIKVTTDSTFATGLKYLQSDGTLNATFNYSNDVQSYAAWGGSSGSHIIGLNYNTTYYAKVAALQEKNNQSKFGPINTPAYGTTASPTLTFNLVTSNQSSPPFSIALGTLTAGNISTSAQTINPSISTNGASGGDIYIRGQNGGLLSGSTGDKITISSTSQDLTSVNDGFGAQSSGVSQTSGGPLSAVSPYNNSGSVVGQISLASNSLYTSIAPITNGTGTLLLKAKSATTDVAATDYQEILTFVASGNF